MRRVASRATREAERLAKTLVTRPAPEKSSINRPRGSTWPMSLRGMTTSTIWARAQGSSRSMMVPVNFKLRPPAMRHT